MFTDNDGDFFIKQLDSTSESSTDIKPIKKINQYLLLRPIGEGSFAKVFYSVNTNTNDEVAIKRFKLIELQCVDSGVSQLEREISAMRRISHPNIIKLYEVLYDSVNDIVYLVIDYANCGSLESIINATSNRENPLDIKIIRPIFVQILHALQYLHSNGIIHQDIKPSNILIKSDGRTIVSDFGVGHSFQSAEMVVGSPAYQAPEAFQDDNDDNGYNNDNNCNNKCNSNCNNIINKCNNICFNNNLSENFDPSKEDIWSLGVTLYQTIFGKLPYEGENVYEIVANIKSTPLVIPECSSYPHLKSLLEMMLCVDQEKRLNVEETLNHPFFDDKNENFDASDLRVHSDPRPDPRAEIAQVDAEVCGPTKSFARANLTVQALLRKNNGLLR